MAFLPLSCQGSYKGQPRFSFGTQGNDGCGFGGRFPLALRQWDNQVVQLSHAWSTVNTMVNLYRVADSLGLVSE
jgi:hypothetical protein